MKEGEGEGEGKQDDQEGDEGGPYPVFQTHGGGFAIRRLEGGLGEVLCTSAAALSVHVVMSVQCLICACFKIIV